MVELREMLVVVREILVVGETLLRETVTETLMMKVTRYVFNDSNDDSVTEAITQAGADAQREHQEMEVEVVAGQCMAEAKNILSCELSVGSSTESAKDSRRERHVSYQFHTFGCCIQSETLHFSLLEL